MKTQLDYEADAINEIELHGRVPHNMRVCLDDHRLVVFGSCLDEVATVVQESASCKDLNAGTTTIVEMVRRILGQIEASGPSVIHA